MVVTMIKCLAAIVFTAMASSTLALDFKQQQKASELTTIVGVAGECNFELDAEAIEKYKKNYGLDTPEAKTILQELMPSRAEDYIPASAAQCFMARISAMLAGFLK
jgi:hypothetical protein